MDHDCQAAVGAYAPRGPPPVLTVSEVPREATAADVATEIEFDPSTTSDLLRRAETKMEKGVFADAISTSWRTVSQQGVANSSTTVP